MQLKKPFFTICVKYSSNWDNTRYLDQNNCQFGLQLFNMLDTVSLKRMHYHLERELALLKTQLQNSSNHQNNKTIKVRMIATQSRSPTKLYLTWLVDLTWSQILFFGGCSARRVYIYMFTPTSETFLGRCDPNIQDDDSRETKITRTAVWSRRS